MAKDPTTPLRAYHRLLKEMVGTKQGKAEDKIEPTPEQFDALARVFQRAGGSWEHVFLGRPSDLALLKKVIKVALKMEFFRKASAWG